MENHASRVLDDLRTAMGQAQQLIEFGTATSRRAGARFLQAKDRALAFEQRAVQGARDAADELDRYAHEHPWRIVVGGIAFAVLLATALTLLSSSKRD